MPDRHRKDRLFRDHITQEHDTIGKSRGLLVVSNSKINRIVISKTAVLAGMRAIETEPAQASDALDKHRPDAVLIDCDGDHEACGALFQRIDSFRDDDGQLLVFVIARNGTTCSHHTSTNVDCVMDAPITTDRLGTALHNLFKD